MPPIDQTYSLAGLSLNDFLSRLASDAPAPGGGAAAALAGALGAALMAMVAGVTLRRSDSDAAVTKMREIRDRAAELQDNLRELIDADAQAYDDVIDAFRPAPQHSSSTREGDSAADRQQAALRQATDVPVAIAAACVDVLKLAVPVAHLGNPNAIADAAAGARLADAGLQSAALNVRSNLARIHDGGYVDASLDRINTLIDIGNASLRQALAAVEAGGGRFARSE